jgi:putative oxidoreductase
MASNSISTSSHSQTPRTLNTTDWNERASVGSFVTLAGRILFSAIFIMTGFFHFSQQEIAYAAHSGVPMAWLLVLFLVPVTLMMHNFWAAKDPMMAQMQMVMFLKNATMLGGALLISQFGADALSLDARRNSAR